MEKNVSSGVGLPGLMFLLFLGLKLTGYIDWSWWWVTAPLWGGFMLAMVLIGLTALFATRSARR